MSHPTPPPEDPRVQQRIRVAAELRRGGRLAEACVAYEQLLADVPSLPDCWYNLGWLRRQLGRFRPALDAYAQALAHQVSGPEEVRLNRAAILSDHLHEPDAALHELQEALRLNPRYAPAWLNLGNLHEDAGRRAEAASAYDRLLAFEPAHPLALARRAVLDPPADALARWVPRLRQRLAQPGLPAAERADLGFALGQVLDAAGDYEAAFAAYGAANAASRASAPAGARPYDPARQAQAVAALLRAYPGTPAPVPAEPGPPVIFVLGMFRSGSTLVEQILGAHPLVRAGGELDLLPRLVREHPQLLGGLPPALAPALRRAYREGIEAMRGDAAFVTDKRPDNFLYIGLVKALFPDARFVHTVRHPLDNCLSVYFQHLGPSQPYALALESTAHWYTLYRDAMAHWKSLHGDAIVEVDYDALVAEPRRVVADLLARLGLPWDDACMAFHAQAAQVKTASVWQVRQPLYARASGRWRHYARHLGAAAAVLGCTTEWESATR